MMARATNTGTLKRKQNRKRNLISQCSRCSSAQRNRDKLIRQHFIGLRLMPQWEK
jgi:hypothetical protein